MDGVLIAAYRLLFVLLVAFSLDFSSGESDFDALMEFKRGIAKDPSGHLSSWSTSPDANVCPNWLGIVCNNGAVTKIDLSNMGLVGNVDLSIIGRLKMLSNLSLSGNFLTGSLVSEIASAGSLQHVDLSGNSFSGVLPTSLTSLQNLTHLDLSVNNFGGSIPSGFDKLRYLKYVDLHANALVGDISTWFSQLKSVVYVDISRNMFHGSFPGNVNNLTFTSSIQYLNISHNSLVGPLFAADVVPLFDSLEAFDASYNQLTGQIVPFTSLFSLQRLHLRSNQFSGELPLALIKESSMVLTELDLSDNNFQGPLPNFTSLTLRYLNLSGNKLSGTLPTRVGRCEVIDLSNNRLSGNLLALLSWGNYVQIIDVSSNTLTGNLPNGSSQFLRLTTLKLSNNLIEGTLPSVMVKYPKLSVIDLSLNKLTGPLMATLFTTLSLVSLNLSRNNFNGTIPVFSSQSPSAILSNISYFPSQNSTFEFLDLSDNSLSGSLPPDIGTLTNLQVLNLRNNELSGSIPYEMTRIQSLMYVDLSKNMFSDKIPDNFPPGLEGFNVSYNNLSGPVPQNMLRFPDSSFHPGNPLLVFPPPSTLPNGVGNGNGRNRLTRVVIEALIAGFVALAVVIFILTVLIYHRGHSCSAGSRRRAGGKDTRDISHGGSMNTKADILPGSMRFSSNRLLSSGSLSGLEDVTPATLECIEEGQLQLPVAKEQSLKSHTEKASPPNDGVKRCLGITTASEMASLSDAAPNMKVPSPERLAGDLHFFGTSSVFSAEELSRAPAEVLGRSSHGTSYKATLDNGHVLIVKWLREGLTKRKKEFSREAKKLGNIQHPNLVSLRGYYWGPKEHERLILSDFVSSESLACYLFEPEPRVLPRLSLEQRVKVAQEIARCLNYLHNEGGIPHGNLKSTNILIEASTLNAFLTDYSLHRLLSPAGTAEQILNAGALGYRAPELAIAEKPLPSLKADVYAFGVILMEILTGKSAGEIISGNSSAVDLTDWVSFLVSDDRMIDCFDMSIPGVETAAIPPRPLELMLKVSLRCILPASERPNIRMVFEELMEVLV